MIRVQGRNGTVVLINPASDEASGDTAASMFVLSEYGDQDATVQLSADMIESLREAFDELAARPRSIRRYVK